MKKSQAKNLKLLLTKTILKSIFKGELENKIR